MKNRYMLVYMGIMLCMGAINLVMFAMNKNGMNLVYAITDGTVAHYLYTRYEKGE